MSKRTKTARAKLNRQHKRAAKRAKYGQKLKPAKVTVRSLETGDVIRVVDQDRFKIQRAADSLEAAAKNAGFKSYAGYLRSRAWKALRQQAMLRDGFRCRKCGVGGTGLQVHHRWYPSVLGEEPLSALETLCSTCHEGHHANHR